VVSSNHIIDTEFGYCSHQ